MKDTQTETKNLHATYEHHRHHEHHSSGKKKKEGSKAWKKIRFFFQKNKKRILINTAAISGAVIVLAAILVLVTSMDGSNWRQSGQSGGDISVATLESSVRLEVPFYTQPQYLSNEAVEAYMNTEMQQSVEDTVSQFWNAKKRLDIGVPVNLRYEVTGLPEGYTVERAVFEISETPDFRKVKTVEPAKGATTVNVNYLKTGTEYFYRITLHISDGREVVTQSSFQTAPSPRMLLVDGAVNVRDIGGWKTLSGQTIRQGLLYRGSELDGRVEQEYSITSKGMDTLLDELQIKSEVDLRGMGYFGSLGEQVQYYNFSSTEYDSLFKEKYNETVCQIFSVLADAENYPVYLHCTYGMDRTGTVCFLLEALLGMEEEELTREYELSAMYFGGVNEERFDDLLVELKRQSGDNLMQKAENYLLSVGMTAEQISSIRSIYLEEN